MSSHLSQTGGSMPPVDVGSRLAAARRSRGLSQEEVAERLGVSRPTLIAIEKGVRAPKQDELQLLAQLFGRTIHELVSPRPFVADFAPMFRATQVTGVTQVAVQAAVEEFKRACEDYLALEEMLGAPMPRLNYPEPYSVGGLGVQAAAEEIAAMERSRLGMGIGPIPDILDVLETDVGLRVFVLPLGEFHIAGMFAFTDRLGGCVLVNGTHPATRQNWSMAHEYAHFLLDRYKEDVTVLAYERKPKNEQFADALAGSFLMPAAGLRQRFRRIVQSRKDFTVADLCLLADQYSVSVEAMTRRLEAIGSLKRDTWDELAGQGMDAAKVQRHLGLQAHRSRRVRLPERYVGLAVQAFEEERITESELMRLLRCSRVEAREIVDRLTRPTEMDVAGETYELELAFGDSLPVTAGERPE
jgi:Zn-dependent peptidase ImmA (M78 family)/transcriptional regulator with XRE-family HTH domain